MERVKRWVKNKKVLLAVLVLGLPAIYGLALPGYFGVHDDMHPAWIYEMYQAFSLGQFPPRWAANLSFGFGYPLFHFVYPLPYYLGALLYWIGWSLTGSVQILQGLALILSGVFMYLFVREYWGVKESLAAAVVYLYSPYRALDIYVRGALGEAVAFVFLPLIAWGIVRSSKTGRWRYVGWTALFVAGLVLSHNLTAMIGLPVLICYGMVEAWKRRGKTGRVRLIVLKQAVSYALGLIISAYFWLPAMIDRKLMVDDTLFNFWDHFPFIRQLIFSEWGYGASLWGPGDGMSFQVGIINWAILLIGGWWLLAALVRRQKIDPVVWYFALVAAASLFLMNIRSAFIWYSLPLLAYFQFPWRLLILTTFCSSFLAGFVIFKARSRIRGWMMAVMLVLPIILTWGYFKPEEVKYVSDEQVFERFFAVNPVHPERESKEYLTLTEEYLRLPKAADKRPGEYAWQKFIFNKEGTDMEVTTNSLIDYEINTSGEANLLISKIYALPGWQVELDGKPIQVKAGKPYGQIEVEVPEGDHVLKIKYGQTVFWQWVNWTSLAGVIVALALTRAKARKQK